MNFHNTSRDSYFDDSSINKLIAESDNFGEFDALFNSEFHNIIIIDRDAKIVSMNEKFKNSISKIKQTQILPGDSVLDVIAAENQQRFLQEFNTALKGEKVISERWVQNDNGNDFCFVYEYTPIKKDKEAWAVLCSILDITGVRATNKIIDAHEQHYLALIDGLNAALFITKPDGTILNANETAVRMFGYTVEEFRKIKRNDFIDFTDPRLDEYLKFRNEKGMVKGELIGIKKGGIHFPIEFSSVIYKNAINDEVQTSTMIIDISDQKRDKKMLYETNKVARVGGWEFNIAERSLYWSDITREIHEVEMDFYPTLENAISFYATESDRARIAELVANAIEHGTPFEEDFRIITHKGKEKWVRSKALVEDFNGVPFRIYGTFQDIDKNKRISLALKESENKLSAYFNSTTDSICLIDKDYKIMSYNRVFENIIQKIWNKKVHVGDSIIDYNNADTIDNFTLHFQQALSGQRVELEKEVFMNSYHSWWKVVYSPINNTNGEIIGVAFTNLDISEKKSEESQLKLLESVITNANDAVLITEAEPLSDEGPKIIYVNNAFTRMTGYTKEEVIGKTPRILQGELSDYKELKKLSEALHQWKSYEVETINYRKDGEPFWVNFSVVPIADDNGWYTHWISIQRETTDRRQKEEERQLLIDELGSSVNELKQFTYITSHNMRAPVTNMLGIFNILEADKINDEFTLKLIDGLKKSTHNLNDTLNDLIKILIVKENKNLNLQELEFDAVLNEVTSSINSIMNNADVELITDFSSAPKLSYNKSYLESIFLNLVTNAIRYSHPERRTRIEIKTMNENNHVKLTFSDNGIGMDMNKVKNEIFGLYKSFHNHSESKGVGLYLVHSQVKTLGGEIEVHSEVNVGTKFTITFKK